MDPKENNQTPQDQGHTPDKKPIDLNEILLPKKETPGQTPLSAERAPAGELLAQEQAAAAPAEVVKPAEPAPAPKVEEEIVKPLETYQRDIESVVQDKNISVLSIASAEAERRAKTGEEDPNATPQEKRASLLRTILFVGGGLVLLVAASGVLAYLVSRPTSVPAVNNTIQAPFISVDGAKNITITSDEKRDLVMANLNAARQATSLSLGLVEQLLVTQSSTTASGDTVQALSPQDFFALVAPNSPTALGRSVENYLLGVHVYDGNQPLIIAKVDSYENAYAAMLSWEPNLQQDLTPLFTYTPTQHIPEQGLATSAPPQAVNTFVAASNFADKIIENQDTRALVNSYGEPYLLWTFIDRNTLVITTNDATLREIISRLKNAPITPIPGGQ